MQRLHSIAGENVRAAPGTALFNCPGLIPYAFGSGFDRLLSGTVVELW